MFLLLLFGIDALLREPLFFCCCYSLFTLLNSLFLCYGIPIFLFFALVQKMNNFHHTSIPVIRGSSNVIQVMFIFSSLLHICWKASLTSWVTLSFISSFSNNWMSMFLRHRFFRIGFYFRLTFATTWLWFEVISATGHVFALFTDDLNHWFIEMKSPWFRTMLMTSSWGHFQVYNIFLDNLNSVCNCHVVVLTKSFPTLISHAYTVFSNIVIYWSFSNFCVHVAHNYINVMFSVNLCSCSNSAYHYANSSS